MDKRGKWRLSPAFDVVYSDNPDGQWTSRHQMLINGKSEEFVLAELLELASYADIRTAKAKTIIAEAEAVFGNWRDYAVRAGVLDEHRTGIEKTLRMTGL